MFLKGQNIMDLFTFRNNVFYWKKPVITKTKTGKVNLTPQAKRPLYDVLIKAQKNPNNPTCSNCGKTEVTRLSIDHIDNQKPLPTERLNIVSVSDYALLCRSCNTRKQRFEDTSRQKLTQPQNVGNKAFRTSNEGIINKDRQKEPNKVLDSNTLHSKLKQEFLLSVKYIMHEEKQITKTNLINYALAHCFEKGIIISQQTALNYISIFIDTPRKLGGMFKTNSEDMIEDI